MIRSSMNSLELVRLLELAQRHGEQGENERYLSWAFDPDKSFIVVSLAGSVPSDGFSSKDQFRSWIKKHKYAIKTLEREEPRR